MNNPLKMVKDDEIRERQVGEAVPEIRTIDPGLGQYAFGHLAESVEFAKLMCQAGEMLPPHARRNPAICLALTMRATHWGFDPFALAEETFQAKAGGPIGYQAKVFTAVARRAKIKLKYRYEGEFKINDKPAMSAKGNQVAAKSATGNLKCICYVTDDDGDVLEYETPELDQVTIKNSPLWHHDPRQQLAYYAGRGWMRRYRADLMMGAYSDDEIESMNMRDVTPRKSEGGGFARLTQQARDNARKPDPEIEEGTEGDDEPVIDTAHPAYLLGVDASVGGLSRGECPYREDRVAALHWLAGWDADFDSREEADEEQDDGNLDLDENDVE